MISDTQFLTRLWLAQSLETWKLLSLEKKKSPHGNCGLFESIQIDNVRQKAMLVISSRFSTTLGSNGTPNTVGASAAQSCRDTEIASVDVFRHKPDRTVSKQGLCSASVIAAGCKHSYCTIRVTVAIIDAGRSVWWSDGVKGINFRLSVAPDGAEPTLDSGTCCVTIAGTNRRRCCETRPGIRCDCSDSRNNAFRNFRRGSSADAKACHYPFADSDSIAGAIGDVSHTKAASQTEQSVDVLSVTARVSVNANVVTT